MEKRRNAASCPKLPITSWHDRINMEFRRAGMDAMLWHRHRAGRFND